MSAVEEHPTAQAHEQQLDPGVPPAGEEIHLPGGSPIPLICAIGITLTVVGSTIDWKIWSVLGFIITTVTVVIWVRDVRRDVEHLPEDHHH